MPTIQIESPKTAAHDTFALPGWRAPAASLGAFADCCLVVPTYSRPGEVMTLLEDLLTREDRPAEVLIADGSPTSSLAGYLKSLVRTVRLPFDLVYVECPRGLTRQRNIGVDISTRPYVFFLDDDSLPLKNYFTEIRKVFIADQEKTVGAVGGSVVSEMDRPIAGRWRLRLALGLVPRVEPMMYASCGTSTPKGLMFAFRGVKRVDLFPGCAFAVRREVLNRHRFSSFFNGYSQGEDLEMSLRVGTEWQVVCCGDAEVVHKAALDGRPASFAKGRMEVCNRYFILKRHRPNAALIDLLRFWADVALQIIFDLLHSLRRFRVSDLSHAAGLFYGVLQCFFSPPRHLEPIARKEYSLAEKD